VGNRKKKMCRQFLLMALFEVAVSKHNSVIAIQWALWLIAFAC
jgi:hypothetical protein